MVRKRSAWERRRDRGRKRKRRAPVVGGFKLTELAKLAGVSPRTITEYLSRGLLSAPEFRGTSTRYEREHLLRLMGIRLCKLDGERSLKAIQQKLGTMGSREIETWVASRELPAEAAIALGLRAQAQAQTSAPRPEGATPRGSGILQTSRASTATWTRLELLPGLELSIQTEASVLAQKVAGQLTAQVERWIASALAAPVSPPTDTR